LSEAELRTAEPGLLLDARVERAKILSNTGKLDESAQEMSVALAKLDQLPVTEDARMLRVTAGTTQLITLMRLGRYRESLTIAERNVIERSALVGPDHPRLAVDYFNLGHAQSRLGLLDLAKLSLSKARTLLLEATPEPSARIASIDASLASIATAQGRLEEAQALLDAAYALATRLLGPAHADVLSIERLVAQLAILRGDSQRAGTILQRLVPAVAKINPPWMGELLQIKAQWLLSRTRFGEAETVCKQALAMGSNSKLPYLLLIEAMRAYAIAAQGKRFNPVDLESKVVELLANEAAAAPLKADAAIYLAAMFQVLGKQAKADQWLASAFELYQRSMSAARARDRASNLLPSLRL
jgi:hypothetical protein